MSEIPEDVPALSAEASGFLKRHASTGEPSPQALERVKTRLPTPRARVLRLVRAAAPLAAAAALVALMGWGWSVLQRAKSDVLVAEVPKQPVAEPPLPVTTLVDESKPAPAPAVSGVLISKDAVPLEDPKLMKLREVYLRAYMLKDSDPAQSRQLLQQIVDEGDPRWETVQKAKSRLRDLGERGRVDVNDFVEEDMDELFQRAYVIRDAQPAEALKLFKRIIASTDRKSPLHQKARRQLEAMK